MNGIKKHICIIITNDYEVMGNGYGDVKRILIQPTAELLKLSESYNIPLTLFVEILEYLKFLGAEQSGVLSSDYKAGTLITEQLHQAVAAGHDLQLHLHPQWIDAIPINADHWEINLDYWRLPDVPKGLGDVSDPRSLRGLFALGKITLENLVRPLCPDYQCIAFRAGGYCIQPEADVLQVMEEQGLLIDSSVSVGRSIDRGLTKYNFLTAPTDLPYWFVREQVTLPVPKSDLIEIPIFTNRVAPSFFRGYRPKKSDMVFSNEVSTSESLHKANIFRRILNYLLPRRLNFDFCKLSAVEMIRFAQSARKRFLLNDEIGDVIPLVMTGHSKEWTGPREMRKFLEWATGIDWIRFMTFPEWLAASGIISRSQSRFPRNRNDER